MGSGTLECGTVWGHFLAQLSKFNFECNEKILFSRQSVNHVFNKNMTMFYSTLKVIFIWRNAAGLLLACLMAPFLLRVAACHIGNEHYRCQLEMSLTKTAVWRQGDCDWYRSEDVFLNFNSKSDPVLGSVPLSRSELPINIQFSPCSWTGEE